MEGRVSLVCPVLVGRDGLLQLADEHIAAGLRGRGTLQFLAGEAGIGKSRLLGSIERRAAAAGFRSVRAGTYPGDLEVTGAVLLDLARSMGRQPDLASTGAAITARLDDQSASGDGDDHRRRRILALDLAEIIADIASAGPTLLALEDLHQADDLTLEILAMLATRAAEAPLLILGTYRSDELYPRVPMRDWRAHMLTKRLAGESRLERLSIEETATMTALILGTQGPAPRALVETVHGRTDGIPLHVEELLGMLRAGRDSQFDALPEADVPDTLDAAILGRLDRRSAGARRVAEVGAVIGRSFEMDLLASTLAMDADHLSRPLTELADHFVLAESAASGRFGFRHGLICDAIYARIPAARRRRLHARVAEIAARRGDFSDAFLSSHFERAGMPEMAFAAALRAARAATRLSSHREAFQLYERVIRTCPAGLPVVELAEIREAHGSTAAACDLNATAAASMEAARGAWLEAGRPIEAAAVVPPLVATRHLLGDSLGQRSARLREALAELDRLAPDVDRDRTRGRVFAGLAAAYMLDRRLDESIGFGESARELALAAGDPATERHATVTVGVCLVFAGRMEDGWSRLEDSIQRSRDAHLEAEAARGYRMLGSCASVLVDYDRAERWLGEGIDYAERVELWNDRHYMAAHLAHVLWATGRWEDAVRIADHALADGRGGITTRITALHVLGFVDLGRGELGAARRRLTEALDAGERMHELQRLSPALWGLAEADLIAGDPAASIARCERGLAASAAVDDAAYLFPYLVTGTRAYLAAHDPSGAERWVKDVSGALRRRGVPGTLPAIDHAAGLLALAGGATGRARAHLGVAADAWRRLRRRWEELAATIDLAECELRTNRLSEAVRLAAAARLSAAALPSPALVERAEAVLGRARALHPTEAPWAPLTAREFEVARLLAGGGTNAAIAAKLGLSPRTVGSHVEHILDKLGAGRRAEIAAWAATIAGRLPPSGEHGSAGEADRD
ncbi:MAG TPA: AAA family ATPase [Candidatus Sulfomarinibacteraceae bacterium]|nr:AAA family ATPase [Candidatus Sulfomarinibacteraceae bacterium]